MTKNVDAETEVMVLMANVENQLRDFVSAATADIDYLLEEIGQLTDEVNNLGFWKAGQRKALGQAKARRERVCASLMLFRTDVERMLGDEDLYCSDNFITWIERTLAATKKGLPIPFECSDHLKTTERLLQRVVILQLP